MERLRQKYRGQADHQRRSDQTGDVQAARGPVSAAQRRLSGGAGVHAGGEPGSDGLSSVHMCTTCQGSGCLQEVYNHRVLQVRRFNRTGACSTVAPRSGHSTLQLPRAQPAAGSPELEHASPLCYHKHTALLR